MSEVKLEGWDELMHNLEQLPARAQKNILRGGVRSAANMLRDEIKERAPILKPDTKNQGDRYPGQLRDAVIAVDARVEGAVAAGVKVAGSREGLKSTVQAGRALRKGKLKAAATALARAIADGYYWRWVEYGSPHNEPAQPFIRPSWDAKKGGLTNFIADYCRQRISRLLND